MRPDRSTSSMGERRAVADKSMMRSISDSGSGAMGRRNNEVDAIKNPTELFRKINSSDWEGALDIVKNNPSDSSIWISRSKDNGPAWKYLPLHLICLQQHPHEELFTALLQSYPQAASLQTPHDGNLPIHYACESGCDNEHVFAALLASFPQSLEVQNKKSKTPLLMCHVKSRGLLMKVLRQRKPLPFDNGVGVQQPKKKQHTHQPQTKKREKDRKSTGGRSSSKMGTSERRNVDSWKDSSEHSKRHRPPKTTPARFVVATDDEPGWDDTITPRVSNHRRSSKRGTKKDIAVEPFFPEEAASASSSEYDTDGTTASYISSKTTEFAMTALNYLYPSYQDTGEPPEVQEREENNGNSPVVQDDQKKKIRLLTRENAEQQRTIEKLTKKLAEKLPASTSSNKESSSGSETDNSTDQLCERILKKAEADNVAFRTQIQQLENEKDKMRRTMELKEKEDSKRFDQLKQILRDRAADMKINVFDDDSTSCDSDNSSNIKDRDQIVEALQTVLSHMDSRNANLHSKITSLETELTQSEVSLKKMQIKNQNMVSEKESISKYYHSVERKASILEEDKEMVQSGLTKLKDRVTSLTVINQSLQEQVDAMSSDKVRQENAQYKSELDRLNAQLVQMKVDKDNVPQPKYSQEHAAEMEKKIEDLQEKNRSLKDTILSNNDKYSKKVQVLTEANKDLRDSLARVRSKSCNSSSSSESPQSSMKVHLEGENKLLYEV